MSEAGSPGRIELWLSWAEVQGRWSRAEETQGLQKVWQGACGRVLIAGWDAAGEVLPWVQHTCIYSDNHTHEPAGREKQTLHTGQRRAGRHDGPSKLTLD